MSYGVGGEVGSNLSVLGAYVAADLVGKAASDHDGRSVSLTVTRKALALLTDLAPRQRAINDRLFGNLGMGTFDMLAGIAARLVHDADDALEMAASDTAGRSRTVEVS